jgi:hypothetical protein
LTLKIIGAGMAGLLAANLLHRHRPVVYESQPSLPNNHSAVLRFRSPVVGEALGIPFKKVKVIKAILPWKNEVADALAYADKNTGTYRSDRSINYGTEVVERYIAPPDLIERMAENVQIQFDSEFDFIRETGKVVSTIPMPSLMESLDYPSQPTFEYVQGVNVKARVEDCEAYVSLAVPDPGLPYSRVSITGNELIVECPWMDPFGEDFAAETALEAAEHLGIGPARIYSISHHAQKYSKILPIDEKDRRAFIFWASVTQGKAFSLGRYATWRPGLLLDDLIQDIRLIDSWIKNGVPGADQHNDLHYLKG